MPRAWVPNTHKKKLAWQFKTGGDWPQDGGSSFGILQGSSLDLERLLRLVSLRLRNGRRHGGASDVLPSGTNFARDTCCDPQLYNM